MVIGAMEGILHPHDMYETLEIMGCLPYERPERNGVMGPYFQPQTLNVGCIYLHFTP